MKTIWKGGISFGLVNIPIKLYTATESHALGFTLLHAKCHTPLKYHRWCPKCEQEVLWEETIKGLESSSDCSDIDFLHDPRVPILANMHPLLSNQNQFFKRNYVILEDFYGKHYILEDIPDALSSINLDQETPSLRKKISIDDLLYNPHYYFHFHNLKFATLEFMHYFKEKRGRDKDRKDVQLMQEHFSNRAL